VDVSRSVAEPKPVTSAAVGGESLTDDCNRVLEVFSWAGRSAVGLWN
jgi:hypothetical protein